LAIKRPIVKKGVHDVCLQKVRMNQYSKVAFHKL